MTQPTPPCEGEREGQLIGRAVAGDRVALTLLLTESLPRLRAHLERRVPGRLRAVIDADDLVQDAHIEVYRNIARFAPRGHDSLYRWVATIAIRKLRNALKARQTLKRGGGRAEVGAIAEESVFALLDLMAGPEKTPSRCASAGEALAAVRGALELLPEPYRQVVQLVYLDGCTVADAASAMGRTERAIHNLCCKAKERLRECLGSQSRFLSRSG